MAEESTMSKTPRREQPEPTVDDEAVIRSRPRIGRRLRQLAVREAPAAPAPGRGRGDANAGSALDRWQDDGGQG